MSFFLMISYDICTDKTAFMRLKLHVAYVSVTLLKEHSTSRNRKQLRSICALIFMFSFCLRGQEEGYQYFCLLHIAEPGPN